MAGITNNLYPPLLPTWMPAFNRVDGYCEIFYSLSNYNNASDIQNVQVVISNQNTNASVLDPTKYPNGIMIIASEDGIMPDPEATGDYKYSIEISKDDLLGGEFELNQIYKVQIRFTGIGASKLPNAEGEEKISPSATWLTNNQSYFSEWSTTCLIKGISAPNIILKNFDESNQSLNSKENTSSMVFTTELVDFAGSLTFNDKSSNGQYYEISSEQETLKSYSFLIYDNSSDELKFDSGTLIPETTNQLYYSLNYALEDGTPYKLVVEFTTSNGYTGSKSYYFSLVQGGTDVLEATITAAADEENGRIGIHLLSTTGEAFLGNVTIRRSSNKTNFTIWEDVKTIALRGNAALDYTWYDYTVESGVWYKYCAQKRNNLGYRGLIISIDKPLMLNLDNMFLTNEEMQLKIKYDPSVNSFKHSVVESRTETLGSQYPFIKRNSKVNYKQFPVSGLITSFCDEDGLFFSKEEAYGNYVESYSDYNEEYDVDSYYDFIYEKKFRDKVIDFLYDNSAKLFRSNTEGNVIVKLMDISFTPNETLGRMLYSFSATAYEIDEANITNYDNYAISTIGTYDPDIMYSYTKIGQIYGTYTSDQNVFTDIQSENTNSTNEGYVNMVRYLKWMRLSFESEPYLVNMDTLSVETNPSEKGIAKNCLMGYLVNINKTRVFVSHRGLYELADADTMVTSISFPIETDIIVDYIAKIEETEDTSGVATKLTYNTKVGQISGAFEPREYVSREIYLKYLENYDTYYQKMMSLDNMVIEANPGVVVYVKDVGEKYNRHVVGDTYSLKFENEDTAIEGFYFCGVHLDNLSKYQVEDGKVFYNNQWYTLNENNDVECAVDALIDYTYEVVKGEY